MDHNLPHPMNDQDFVNHHCLYFTPDEFISNFNKHNAQFSLIHCNARSLNNNFESIEIMLSSLRSYPFSVIAITETWLNSRSPLFHLDNYTTIRTDRKHGRGGGVALFIHDKFNFKVRSDIFINDIETLFVEIVNDTGKNIIVVTIYNPPNNPFELFIHNLESCLNTLSHENKEI